MVLPSALSGSACIVVIAGRHSCSTLADIDSIDALKQIQDVRFGVCDALLQVNHILSQPRSSKPLKPKASMVFVLPCYDTQNFSSGVLFACGIPSHTSCGVLL